MSKRESILALFVLTAVCLAGTVHFYKKVYLPKICRARSSITKSSVPELIGELQSAQSCIRSSAALDLQKAGEAGSAAIPYLLALTDDRDDSVRWRSIAALGHGITNDVNLDDPQVKEIQEAAVKALQDSHQTTRYNAVFVLGRLKSAEAVRGLAAALRDSDAEVRFRAAQDLSWSLDAERDKEILPETIALLTDLQNDPVEKVRARAAGTLGILERGSQKKLPGGQFNRGQSLADEFDHILSREKRNRVEEVRWKKSNERRPEDLVSQFERLEAGIAALKREPKGSEAMQFVCWLGTELRTFYFKEMVFREDFEEISRLLAQDAVSGNACLKSAKEKLNEIVRFRRSPGDISCPDVSR